MVGGMSKFSASGGEGGVPRKWGGGFPQKRGEEGGGSNPGGNYELHRST